MFKIYLLCMFLIISITRLNANGIAYQADSTTSLQKKCYFSIRYGKGGFKDERSPMGKLGGGQLAIYIKPNKLPLAISISHEYYTNSNNPTNPYEISGLTLVNCLYSKYFLKKDRLNILAGAGLGGLTVPQGTDTSAKGMLYNIEAGINVILFWKIGLYGTYRYLYANKEDLINFNSHIILIGLTFNFGL